MSIAGDKRKFLGGSGTRLTKQLFVEYAYISDNDNAVYTLARHDKEFEGRTYPSLYQLYMAEGDVTEARFVERYLYDWEQWERLQKNPVIAEEIERWRKDLKQKVGGQLVDELMSDAFNEDSKTRTSSAKYLLDNIIKPKARSSAGRPKNKTGPTVAEDKLADSAITADLERIRSFRKAEDGKT